MQKTVEGSRLKRFLFSNQSTAQTIVKNTFWLSFGEIMGRLLRVVIIFFAARILGVAEWGTLSYATSLAAIFTVFSDVGLTSILIREGAKDESLRQSYFATSFFLKVILVVISFLLILFFTDYISGIPLPPTLIYAIAILFVFDSVRRFGTSLFRAEEKMELEAFINILTQVIIVIAGFIVLFTVPSPESLTIAYAVGSGIGLIITIWILRRYVKNIFSGFDRKLIKPIISAAWPMTLASIFGVLLINIDTVMIGWFYDAGNVGYYAAAQKPIGFLYLLPAFIVGGLFPTLSRLLKEDVDGFGRAFERGLATVALMAYPLAIGIALTAEQIVQLFYGSDYLPSAQSLSVLALSLIVTFPVSVIIYAIFTHNRQKETVPIWVVGSLVNVGLNLYLIPLLGIVGAALSSLFTQVGTGIFMWRKIKQMTHFSLKGRLVGPIIASVVMTISIILANLVELPFVLIILLSTIVYFSTLIFLRDRTLNELTKIIRYHDS